MRRPKALLDDVALVDAVGCELEWDPKVDALGVRVSAKDGAVMLSGHVPSAAQKRAAVRAAERVSGVRVVADDIDVRLPERTVREDRELAEAIAQERASSARIPESIEIQVNKARVTLRGEVQWSHQREDVERAIRHLSGVRGVSNRISLQLPQRRARRSWRSGSSRKGEAMKQIGSETGYATPSDEDGSRLTSTPPP